MSTPPTHLLIDGSNVLQAWPDTRAMARRDREAAKALLLRRVAVLHDFAGWRVTVVFDGRGENLSVEAIGDAADFACLHTPAGATADDVIEQLVGRALVPAACLVATADQHADQLAVYGIEYALEVLKGNAAPADRETPVDLVTAEAAPPAP